MATAEENVKKELELYEEKQSALATLTEQLQTNPQFQAFLKAREEFETLEKRVWKDVETVMLENDITQIKTDRITLSLATRNNFKVDIEKLPKKYLKVTADLTKINGVYKLEGTLPKGVKVEQTRYLTKRIKAGE